MISSRILAARLWAAAASVALAAAIGAANADSPAPADPMAADGGRHSDAARRHGEEIQHHLDRAAERLEIKASQQAAWSDYSNAVKALGEHARPTADKDRNGDAATLAHQRAEAVTAMAQKLTRLADATSKLQAVLSPDQRSVLDEITRAHFERFRMRRAHFMHGPMGFDDGRPDMRGAAPLHGDGGPMDGR